MKATCLSLLFLCIIQLTLVSFAFSQNFVWAKQANLYNYEAIVDVSMDEDGNVYTVGAFLDSAKFENMPTVYTDVSAMYLTKYNPAGGVEWVKIATGSNTLNPTAMDYDNHGNLYVIGRMTGTVYFDTAPETVDVGNFSQFLAKYDTTGNLVWVQVYSEEFDINPNEYIQLYDVACSPTGEVNVIGRAFNYNFNGTLLNPIINDYRCFVAQLDGAGNNNWIEEIGGDARPVFPEFIETDSSGNIVFAIRWGTNTGISQGEFVFDATTVLSNSGQNNHVLAKYTSNGDLEWAQVTDDYRNYVDGLNIDAEGSVYVSRFTQESPVNTAWLDKRSLSGDLIWSKSGQDMVIRSSFTSLDGSSYLHIRPAYAEGLMSFDGFEIDFENEADAIVKIDSNGNVQWVKYPHCGYSKSKMSGSDKGTVAFGGGRIWSGRVTFDRNVLYNNDVHFDFIALLHDTAFQQTGTNSISGNIFDDNDANCAFDISDFPLEGFPVVATPGPFYATTDSLGNYRLVVDTEDYIISQIPISSHQFTTVVTCPPNNEYSVSFFSTDSVIDGLDFVNDYNSCYMIEVDYGQFDGEDLCDSVRQTLLEICNHGEEIALDVSATLHYPSRMIPLGSSIPWTSLNLLDSTMVFDLGDIPADSCISIFIMDSITCITPYEESYGEPPYFYHAQVTPVNTCFTADTIFNSSSHTEYIDYYLPVGFSEADRDKISVYPNPVTNELFIKGVSSGLLEFFDALGQLVLTTRINGGANTASLDSGLYFLRIFDPKGQLLGSTRIVVSH